MTAYRSIWVLLELTLSCIDLILVTRASHNITGEISLHTIRVSFSDAPKHASITRMTATCGNFERGRGRERARGSFSNGNLERVLGGLQSLLRHQNRGVSRWIVLALRSAILGTWRSNSNIFQGGFSAPCAGSVDTIRIEPKLCSPTSGDQSRFCIAPWGTVRVEIVSERDSKFFFLVHYNLVCSIISGCEPGAAVGQPTVTNFLSTARWCFR